MTMGALLRFKKETGREVTEVKGDSISDMITLLWCCVASACKRLNHPFEMSLMDMADSMDQDDFAQEARIMMLRAVRKYDENHAVSFAGYYQRCLKNLAVECLRREHRQRLIPHELVVRGEKAELALLSASVDSCERQVLLHEEAEEYFHHLSRFERDVFLGVLDGATFEEMANHFDKSVTSIKGAHKRCKKKFKDYIGEG